MNSLFRFFFKPTTGPGSIVLVRLAVGMIFFTQGILKFVEPNIGVVRFTKIGFSHPYFTAHFVGAFEIVCGLLVIGRIMDQGSTMVTARKSLPMLPIETYIAG